MPRLGVDFIDATIGARHERVKRMIRHRKTEQKLHQCQSDPLVRTLIIISQVVS